MGRLFSYILLNPLKMHESVIVTIGSPEVEKKQPDKHRLPGCESD
ncbi:hypothetical protein [Aeromonas veronii]